MLGVLSLVPSLEEHEEHDPMRLASKIPVSDYNCLHFEGLKPPTISSKKTQYINSWRINVAG